MKINRLFSLLFLILYLNITYLNCAETIVTENKGKLHGQLSLAISNGKISEVEDLLKIGADVNYKENFGLKFTALLHAAYCGRTEIFELLLSKGADFDCSDRDGWTPLMYAALRGNKKMAQLLLKAGANVEWTNEQGESALEVNGTNIDFHNFTKSDSDEIAQLLKDESAKRAAKIKERRDTIIKNIDKVPTVLADLIAKYDTQTYLDIPMSDR